MSNAINQKTTTKQINKFSQGQLSPRIFKSFQKIVHEY